MACLADAALAGTRCLTHFNLDVVDPLKTHQQLASFRGNAFTLALGKARKVESEDCPWGSYADLINPAKFQCCFAASSVFDLFERLGRLLGRCHLLLGLGPNSRGAPMTDPHGVLSWPGLTCLSFSTGFILKEWSAP